eukprot:Gb_21899 [translate_table: standard]
MATPDYSFLITSNEFVPLRRLARKVEDEEIRRVSSPKTFSVAKVSIGSEEHVTASKECGMEKQSVIFVEIIGMGGIGKITLAKALFGDTGSIFSRASYIEDVKCQVEKYGLKYIHHILLRQLLVYDFEVSNSNQGVHMLKMKPKNVFAGNECVRGRSLVSGEAVLWNEDEFGNRCAYVADLFANTNELQLLELTYDCLKGDFGKLSQKPLLHRWRNFLYDRVTVDLHTKRIRALGFLGRVPESMAKLPGLQKVDFPQCIILTTIPDEFCYLKALEVLNLNICRKLKYLPPCIGDLSRLETLRLDDCPRLKEIPTTVGQASRNRYLRRAE